MGVALASEGRRLAWGVGAVVVKAEGVVGEGRRRARGPGGWRDAVERCAEGDWGARVLCSSGDVVLEGDTQYRLGGRGGSAGVWACLIYNMPDCVCVL